jgi:hypothetical protein
MLVAMIDAFCATIFKHKYAGIATAHGKTSEVSPVEGFFARGE